MRILVLGGTQFIGRHIALALVEGGHAVSVLNRGLTRDELPPGVERLRGDRDQGAAGLDALAGSAWDACVDVSGFTARRVRASAEALRRKVGRYVFVSSVSVYGDPPRGPVTEAHPCIPPCDEGVTEVDADTYGPLKVASENIVREVFGERCATLRPQIVAGAHDPLDRFSYWVRRARQGGEMLAPGDGTDFVQFIDARDVARFARTVCEDGLAGPFNMSGPRLTWSEFMATLGARNLAWVPAELLRAAGLTFVELPMYRENRGPRSSLMHVSHERALSAGLVLTDPAVTVREVRAWVRGADLAPALSREREAELINKSRAR